VIASGDLMTAEDAAACVRETGAAGVMFARGALKDPLVFDRYRQLVAGCKPADRTAREIIDVVSRHARFARRHARDQAAGLKKMRTFVPRYIKGIPGASRLRNSLVRVSNWRELEELMHELEHAN
jgi:tRNA-dihydrouridine synthase B